MLLEMLENWLLMKWFWCCVCSRFRDIVLSWVFRFSLLSRLLLCMLMSWELRIIVFR